MIKQKKRKKLIFPFKQIKKRVGIFRSLLYPLDNIPHITYTHLKYTNYNSFTKSL